jgi:hypothetical protein
MSRIGPYSKARALAALDGRSREGRLVRDTRADLVAHVGGKPSAAERILIERAVQLTLQLALFDRRVAEGRDLDERAMRQYLAWSNGLSRLLRTFGMKGSKATVPARSLAEYVAEKRAAS